MLTNSSRAILRFVSCDCDGGGGSGRVASLKLVVDGGREGGTRLGEAGTASECSIWYAATRLRISNSKFSEILRQKNTHPTNRFHWDILKPCAHFL